jgi:hypothetical protein
MRRRCALALVLSTCASCASGAYLTVIAGPAFDATTFSGYQSNELEVVPGSTAGNGAAVAWASKYIGGTIQGIRAIRWNAFGGTTELGHLGTNSIGVTETRAYAINSAGAAVGLAQKWSGSTSFGHRAVRWGAAGIAGTELGHLGTNSSGRTACYAVAINNTGTAAGDAQKYSGGSSMGYRAVRWDASGTAATELGIIGTDSSGSTNSHAYAINSAGTVAGNAMKYSGGSSLGSRAVRWDASGTAATELGHLGTRITGVTFAYAHDINDAGTTVGYAAKYNSGTFLGNRAVRWDASGTAATELGNLGTDINDLSLAIANSINSEGAAAGYAEKFVGNVSVGIRAVRWDAGQTAATELRSLGTDGGITRTEAHAINDAGIIVGYSNKYVNNFLVGTRAVLWNFDAVAIDLNTLIDPASGWTLTEARGISDTNWVTGIGVFDPDGTGSPAAYRRAFLLDVSSAIPEPAAVSLLALTGAVLLRRRRAAAITSPTRTADC